MTTLKQSKELEPWRQLTDEPDEAFKAFGAYLKNRHGLTGSAGHMQKSHKVREWFIHFDWLDRGYKFNRLIKLARGLNLAEVLEMAEVGSTLSPWSRR